jgi:hypothetical protein
MADMNQILLTTGDAVAILTPQAGSGCRAALTLQGSGARCIAADPRNPQTIYVGSGTQGLFRSDDTGHSWRRLTLPHPRIFSVAVSPADGAVYAGSEPSMLLRSRDRGTTWEELSALRSVPSAPTWSYPPRPWTSHVRWIAPCPHEADLVLAGIELGGIMTTRDGGRTFADHPPGAQKDVHALAWHPAAPGCAYQAAGGGAAWTRDFGKTWHPADDGRDRHYCWALAVDPADPGCWFISAAPGPRNAHSEGDARAHLYRWRGNGPWEQLRSGLADPLDAMPYALACPSSGRVYAALRDGRMMQSLDGGGQWQGVAIEGETIDHITAMVLIGG